MRLRKIDTAEDLKAWRARLGMTQAEAAEALGVDLRRFKRWEADGPAWPRLVSLACAWLESSAKG